MPSQPRQLVILGAGVCGLYAALTALRDGWSVTVLEKAEQAGGLAAGIKRGDNHYDLGVHMLHAFDQEIFDDIAQLMGKARIEVPLDARIRWNGRDFRYPLKGADLIQGLPPLKLFQCLAGLVIAEIKRGLSPSQPANAEEALIDFYGAPLYEFFFENFTHRYWGIHPREISPEFIRRKMPRLSAVDFLRERLRCLNPWHKAPDLVTDGPLSEETLHYSKIGAAGMIHALTQEIEKLGGKLLLQSTPRCIKLGSPHEVQFEHDSVVSHLHADKVISTIPIPALLKLIDRAPQSVLQSAIALRYKPIAIQGLLVKKRQATQGLYTYYRNRVFHRVGEPANAGLITSPSSNTILIVEMTCEVGDAKWTSSLELRQQIISDLEAEGICQAKDIIEWHPLTYAEGYPIYQLDFEPHLERVETWLDAQPNLTSTGRQGAFTYPAMHQAMRMGADAVHEKS